MMDNDKTVEYPSSGYFFDGRMRTMLVNHPERLKNNPRVKSANMYGIELKENYLIEIFDAWKKGGETGVIKDLNENGIQVEDVGS